MKSIKFLALVFISIFYIQIQKCSHCGTGGKATSYDTTSYTSKNSFGIINNTQIPLEVGFLLPEQTIANVHINKLDSPLFEAVLRNSKEEIKQALFKGSNIHQKKDGKNLLFWAIDLQHYIAIKTLLKLGAKPDDICKEQTLRKNDTEAALLLVQLGNVNFDGSTLLQLIQNHELITDKDATIALELIKELINRQNDSNDFWLPALYLACHRPHEGEEAVKFLLSHNANPNHYIDTWQANPLSLASVTYPNKHIVKILLDTGKIDINQKFPFYNSSSKIRPLPYNQPSNSYNYDTVLLRAIKSNVASDPRRAEIIDLLLEHGATLCLYHKTITMPTSNHIIFKLDARAIKICTFIQKLYKKSLNFLVATHNALTYQKPL